MILKEQMTLYRGVFGKTGIVDTYLPKDYDPSKPHNVIHVATNEDVCSVNYRRLRHGFAFYFERSPSDCDMLIFR